LRQHASRASFDLIALSGFRSFERQLSIWNAKAQGTRPLLNDQGAELSFDQLSPLEIVHAILRWSALPGASRHHWGTDFDIAAKNLLPSPDYVLQLTPDEVAPDGIMGAFHLWLDEFFASNQDIGFYRPYDIDRAGVAPEMWHISYFPLAEKFKQALDQRTLFSVIEDSEIELKDILLEHQDEIYSRYIVNVAKAPY